MGIIPAVFCSAQQQRGTFDNKQLLNSHFRAVQMGLLENFALMSLQIVP